MRKKLAIFCDGTWNDLGMAHRTNVARLAKCVASANGDIPQIVFYDEGVGVPPGVSLLADSLVKLAGGAFGRGLDQKIAAAYCFLVTNYEPGDDIYIFGFSRGAYTARSLCGLIRKCGILKRAFFDKVPAAMALYRDGTHPREPAAVDFRTAYAHEQASGSEDHVRLKLEPNAFKNNPDTYDELIQYRPIGSYRLMYLGVWDTVGSMGVPDRYWLLKFLNRKYRFHDTDASSLIASIRHAVAIDEQRRVFGSTGMQNIDALNREWADKTNWNVTDPHDVRFVAYPFRPYQQMWFPGDHGAVGGGNAQPGLSSWTLRWIAEGAERAGLKLRWTCPPADPPLELEDAARLANACANWQINKDGTPKKPWQKDLLGEIGGYRPRSGPPTREEIGASAVERTYRDPKYRPANLSVLTGVYGPPSRPTSPPAGFPTVYMA